MPLQLRPSTRVHDGGVVAACLTTPESFAPLTEVYPAPPPILDSPVVRMTSKIPQEVLALEVRCLHRVGQVSDSTR